MLSSTPEALKYSGFLRRKSGSNFNPLLISATLHRAVAGAEMNMFPSASFANNLNLKMVESVDTLLDKHAFIIELTFGVIADTSVNRTEFIRIVYFFNPHPSTTGGGFNHDGRA